MKVFCANETPGAHYAKGAKNALHADNPRKNLSLDSLQAIFQKSKNSPLQTIHYG